MRRADPRKAPADVRVSINRYAWFHARIAAARLLRKLLFVQHTENLLCLFLWRWRQRLRHTNSERLIRFR